MLSPTRRMRNVPGGFGMVGSASMKPNELVLSWVQNSKPFVYLTSELGLNTTPVSGANVDGQAIMRFGNLSVLRA